MTAALHAPRPALQQLSGCVHSNEAHRTSEGPATAYEWRGRSVRAACRGLVPILLTAPRFSLPGGPSVTSRKPPTRLPHAARMRPAPRSGRWIGAQSALHGGLLARWVDSDLAAGSHGLLRVSVTDSEVPNGYRTDPVN